MRYPLEDLQVLDLSHALAGPYCTLLLAQYGARVYKLEPPEGGDIGRSWGPPFQGGESSFFLALHPNKLGVSINLKDPRGRDLCLRLMEKVDVVIENFRPGSMERLGLGYEAASRRNPRLVYCSVSGYGQNGPSRDLPAMDLILQASSGLISVTGAPGGPVARCGHSVADITAGMLAAFALLVALRAREQTGRGQFIDISMLDAMISAMSSNFANYLGTGEPPGPMGTAFKQIVPYRTFPTADREIAVAVASDKLWAAFCPAIGKPELAVDPRYATNPLRVANRGELEPMLIEWFRARPSREWQERLDRAGVPCAPVRTLDEVCADPQTAMREMIATLPHPTVGDAPVTGVPAKFSDTPGQTRFAAPLLGQHTREVLHSLLCLEEAALDRLEEEGVIVCAPDQGREDGHLRNLNQ